MGEGCCVTTETYECAKDKEKCPSKEVKKGDSVPECCGTPMTKKTC